MSTIQNSLKNAMLTQSLSLPFETNDPVQYEDRQTEYYEPETRVFIEKYAKYSSDYVIADVQGLNPAEPFEYTQIHLRFADIIRPSASMSRNFDSYKIVQVAERQYSYLRKGAKVNTMGSTWFVTNPVNLSGGGTAIVQKCDAVWHYLDYYGNVCSEPMCVDTLLMRANDADSQRSSMITKGYFTATMQYNEATASLLSTNARIILGTAAYRITGYSDFIQEFTSVEDSINMIEFSIRYEEPNDAIDDMVNKVAGGKTFKWDINVAGISTLYVGETEQFTATSIRTSGGNTETVSSTDEYPIDYIWSSSDENIATVDENGIVTAVATGTATITATLAQNPNAYESFDILVAEATTSPHIVFTDTLPESLNAYDNIALTALYVENGQETPYIVEWSFSGAEERCYSVDVDDNDIVIHCWAGSIEPLVITASYNGYSASVSLILEGI